MSGRRCASTSRTPTTTPSPGSCTTSRPTAPSATTSRPSSPASSTARSQQWWAEAERHGVLPLDDRMIELFGARFRDGSPHPSGRRYRYRPPMSPIPNQASAAIGGRSFDLTARVTRQAGDEGVLYATGTENSGISVFVQGDRFVVDYNAFDAPHGRRVRRRGARGRLGADRPLPAGRGQGRHDRDRGRRRGCRTGRPAAVHADHVVRRRQRRLRPRLAGLDPLRRPVRLHRHVARGRHPARLGAAPDAAEAQARAEMSRQ